MTGRSAFGNVVSSGGQAGFAMIELIIAFAILALGMGAILVGVTTATRSDARAHDNRIMIRIAQSHLEAAGVTSKLVVGHREGRTGVFIWRNTVTSAAIFTGNKKGKSPPEMDGGLVPVWIEMVVRAPDGNEAKLSALKFAPRVVQ